MLQTELQGLAHELRRRRRQRLVVRALWLGLAWIGVLLVARLWGVALAWPVVVYPGLAIMGVGALYAWLSQPSLARLCRAYDRYYELHQELATALEVVQGTTANTLSDRLIERATLTARQLRHAVRKQPVTPWREWELLGAVLLIIAALGIAGGRRTVLAGQPVPLPPLPSPIAAMTPPPQDQPVAATPPPLDPQSQAVADALADALRDTGATRPAADALDQGDTKGAAQDLRDLADRADQLSPDARKNLADDLQRSADQLRDKDPQAADQLDQAAGEMQDDPAQAMRDLGQMADDLGNGGTTAQQDATAAPGEGQAQQPGDQPNTGQSGAGGAGDGLGGESRTKPAEPLQAAGEALPLPTPRSNGGPLTNATGPQGPKVELGAGGVGNQQNAGGGGGNGPLPGEADPLRIPPEDRDVVENYFSPAP